MVIREERPHDAGAILTVLEAAFHRRNEGRLVERLRGEGLIVASVVAVADNRIVGSAVFSKLPIATHRGEIDAVALAPVAVAPAYQRRGIGTALVEHGLHLCKQRKMAAAVVLGDPAYYARFGFSAEFAKDIRSPFSGAAWMGLNLTGGVRDGIAGSVTYPSAFDEVE